MKNTTNAECIGVGPPRSAGLFTKRLCKYGDVDLPLGIEDEALAQPTRARIYRYLTDRRAAASTEEIAAALGLHPNGVRRHLERLAAAGLVERRRKRGERGRPGDRWAISPEAVPGGERPSGYAELAGWLARAIREDVDLADIERTGREIGHELAPEAGGDNDAAEVVGDVLAALGFQPLIEARDDGGFTCTLKNCPYRDSARGFPEVVCTLHRGITEGLLAEIAPEARLETFQPRDPARAGCLISVAGGGAD